MFHLLQTPSEPPVSLTWSLVWLGLGIIIGLVIILRLFYESTDNDDESTSSHVDE